MCGGTLWGSAGLRMATQCEDQAEGVRWISLAAEQGLPACLTGLAARYLVLLLFSVRSSYTLTRVLKSVQRSLSPHTAHTDLVAVARQSKAKLKRAGLSCQGRSKRIGLRPHSRNE